MKTTTVAADASFLHRHPWIFVVLAFALLISAWSALITVAVKNSPEVIEVTRQR
jgi:hypothetical protein